MMMQQLKNAKKKLNLRCDLIPLDYAPAKTTEEIEKCLKDLDDYFSL